MHTDVWYDLALRELVGEHGSAGELLREAELAQAPNADVPGEGEHEPEDEADQTLVAA